MDFFDEIDNVLYIIILTIGPSFPGKWPLNEYQCLILITFDCIDVGYFVSTGCCQVLKTVVSKHSLTVFKS